MPFVKEVKIEDLTVKDLIGNIISIQKKAETGVKVEIRQDTKKDNLIIIYACNKDKGTYHYMAIISPVDK